MQPFPSVFGRERGMSVVHAMLRLGFSPCPNDTFIFYALVHGKVDSGGLGFELVIEDVETLNRLALRRELEVSKVSCHAFAHLEDDYLFLRSGGAFGRGCGPLVVTRQGGAMSDLGGKRIAIPGEFTTAFLLLKLYFSAAGETMPASYVAMPFHEIMEAVRTGACDAGLIIHESRFTYRGYGLKRSIDLGEWWEAETGLPLPLGGIVAKRSLGETVIAQIEDSIRRSVEYAGRHRDEARWYVRKYARESSEEVVGKHISLYVNDYSRDIGEDGQAALDELLRRAHIVMKEHG
jgi:1,4-dihydroxy-6-naphthoate synthase